eukprot:TRINITY_DN40122_c0_g1_i1.p1 TRINITY_DN40122_c0_g1~~TRINITY_DN40122_c0_g1_i1.p1  ORF type:complete len:1330 (+),score=219.21 TRINITY_DN40122_c0_g1_i1:506-4495(+)
MATHAAAGGRRVKLYVLTDDGKWDDRGTGCLTCHSDPHTKLFTVRVLAESTGALLLSSQLRPPSDAYYRRPEQNIISWNERAFSDSNSPTEVALSFADPDGCAELWRKILLLDSHMPRSPPQHTVPQQSQTDVAASSHSANESQQSPQPSQEMRARASPPHDTGTARNGKSDLEARDQYHQSTPPAPLPDLYSAVGSPEQRLFDDTLPHGSWNHDAIEDVLFQEGANLMCLSTTPNAVRLSPTMTANLPGVEQVILSMSNPDRDGLMTLVHLLMQAKVMESQGIRQAFVKLVCSSQFMESLCKSFRETEVRGDVELLGALNILVRSLFRLGANNVLEVLLSEKYLTDVIGCLEYDEQNLPRFSKALNELKRKRKLRDEKNSSDARQRKAENASAIAHIFGSQHDEHVRKAPDARNAKASLIECQSDSLSMEHKSRTDTHSALVGLPVEDVTEASSEFRPVRATELRTADGLEKAAIGENVCKDSEVNMCSAVDDVKQVDGLACPPSKNNDEETTSSGNMASQDLDKPLVLRRHRDFLERTVLYKSVIPITDLSVLAKIHQNYRITYIRDVILSRANDETIANSLSNLTVFNNVDIIMYFIRGNIALREVFERLNHALDQRRKLRFGSISSNDRRPYSAQEDSSGDADFMQAQSDDVKREGAHHQVCDASSPHPIDGTEAVSHEGNKSEHDRRVTESTNSSRSRATQAASDTNITSSREASTTLREPCSDGGQDGKKSVYDSGTYEIKSSERSIDIRSELLSTLGFLKELCGIVRGQQVVLKDRFYSLLLELGILDTVLILLDEEDNALRSLACDILSAVIVHNPIEARNRIMKNVTQQDSSVPRKHFGNEDANRVESKTTCAVVTKQHSALQQARAKPEASIVRIDERASDSDKTVNDMRDQKSIATLMQDEAYPGRSSDNLGESGARKQTAETRSVMMKDLEKEKENKGMENEVKKGNGRCEQSNENKNIGGKGKDVKYASVHRSNGCSKRNRARWRVETEFPLLSMMMKIICEDSESGLVLCMLDMVRVLVDPLTMRAADKAKFLEVFYGKLARRLLDPIVSTGRWHEACVDTSLVENVGYLCDMLSFCVVNHDYHARYFVIGHDVGAKVCMLLLHPRAHVRLAAIRFVRTCIGMCEDFYDSYLVRRGLVGNVMDVFARNGGRDNLTQSAILELVSFVTRRGRGLVLREVVEQHSNVLAGSAQHSGVYGDARRRWEELRGEEGRWDRVAVDAGMGDGGGVGLGQVMTGVESVFGMELVREGERERQGEGRLSMSSSEVRARGGAAVEGAVTTGAWQADSSACEEDDGGGAKRRRVCAGTNAAAESVR